MVDSSAGVWLFRLPPFSNLLINLYMSSIALARKWRPQTFSSMVGQTHVTQALTNALSRNRLHHAYLFTGTRGVGKTSVARLFAKALSCEQGPTAEPCLKCDACVAITEGRYIDLLEIDAASKTRVEDTRELLENVNYTPTQGRFKIYLIDEVHMLSTHSFNALLKTLEEPPSHVKFLLATTEPQKLPLTVRSRCLHFQLTALDEDEISSHLKTILNAEQIQFEDAALALIAEAAQGSIRDALSLLDQMIVLSEDKLTEASISSALGYSQTNHSTEILEALTEPTARKLLSISQAIQKSGGQYEYVLEALLKALHQASSSLALGKPSELPCFSPEDLQLFYEITLKGREALELAPTKAMGFEMTLLRLYAFKPATTAQFQAAPAPPPPVKQASPAPAPQKATPTATGWDEMLPKLKLTGLALNAAQHASFKLESDTKATLTTLEKHISLFTKNTVTKIEKALSDYLGKVIKLSVTHQDEQPETPALQKQREKEAKLASDEQTLAEDDAFQALKNTFSLD